MAEGLSTGKYSTPTSVKGVTILFWEGIENGKGVGGCVGKLVREIIRRTLVVGIKFS